MRNIGIEIGKTYNVFDDGKIKESRLYKVTIQEIISFSNIDKDTLQQWEGEVEDGEWLYAAQTDFFIKTWNGKDVETFVRTIDGGWFSMGSLCSGRLDVDGSLFKSISL